jgi:hypothetical protein
MNSAELQTILQTLLREQEQRFAQILDTLRAHSIQNGGTNATAVILPNGPQDVSAPRLPDIEAFVVAKKAHHNLRIGSRVFNYQYSVQLRT